MSQNSLSTATITSIPCFLQCVVEFKVTLKNRYSDDSSLVVLQTLTIITTDRECCSYNHRRIVTRNTIKHINNDMLEMTAETQLEIDTISVRQSLTKPYSMTQNSSAYHTINFPRTEKPTIVVKKSKLKHFSLTQVPW